ncbi:MAG: hypothetical protein COA50_07310 [Flavobacteriaceae bacterium]|nr:MAG: hypothetical protein COA50_07310 [Flavobacteriaceae bacterium]
MGLFTYRINRIAIRHAALWFISGNILFLLALIKETDFIIALGLGFLLLFIIIHIILLFILVINMLIHFKDIEEHMTATILLLLNIPLAGLYLTFLMPL